MCYNKFKSNKILSKYTSMRERKTMKKQEIIEMINLVNQTKNEDDEPILTGRKEVEGGCCIQLVADDPITEIISKFIDAVEYVDDHDESYLLPKEVVDFYADAPWVDCVEEEEEESHVCTCGGTCEEGTCDNKEKGTEKVSSKPKTTKLKWDLKSHEAANIFPMDFESIVDLAQDIKQNGQQEPIKLFEGKILDGRRRYEACKTANVEPVIIDVVVKDPIAYVVSLNIHRRHLTPSQRALAASKARKFYDDEAKERQTSTLKKGTSAAKVKVPEREKGQSRDKAGKAVGVSGKMVDYATKVQKKGDPELVEAVEQGKLSVKVAAKAADKPRAEQKKIAENAKKGIKPEKEKLTDDVKMSEKFVVDTALSAITVLDRVPKENVHREVGLKLVENWLKEQREKFPVVQVAESKIKVSKNNTKKKARK